jgi:hypothetical protein
MKDDTNLLILIGVDTVVVAVVVDVVVVDVVVVRLTATKATHENCICIFFYLFLLQLGKTVRMPMCTAIVHHLQLCYTLRLYLWDHHNWIERKCCLQIIIACR